MLDGLSLTMLGVVTGVGFFITCMPLGICVARKVTPFSSLTPTCLSRAWWF
ncbi:hypothetical protein ACLK1S_14200 [Escherichia coli]